MKSPQCSIFPTQCVTSHFPLKYQGLKKKKEKGPKRNLFSLKMCQIFICIFWTKQWRFQELLSAVFVCCEEKVEQEEKG